MLYSQKLLATVVVGWICFLLAPIACADVTARRSGDVLTIIDTGSNPHGSITVHIRKNDQLVVEASNDTWTGTTTQTFSASRVRRIRLISGPGNDQVILRTTINQFANQIVQSYPDIDVEIQTGSGNDRVFLVGADFGNVSIQTGVGNDRVALSTNSVINEDLTISTAGGNDDVSFNTIEVLGFTNVTTGAGSDLFETYRSMFTRRVTVDTGANTDQISIGGPAQFSHRQNFFLGILEINSGTGSDLVNVDNGQYHFVEIDGGTGADCYVPYGTFRFDSAFRLSNIDVCRPEFPFGSEFVYKTVGNRDLELIVIKPDDWEPTDNRPAILFFHGGSWISGTPLSMRDHSEYFAKRGLVCMMVEYRLLDRTVRDEPPVICINDAKSAMRFVRSHAAVLGIDPNRIASSGSSAGGHLAAFLGTTDGVDDPQDNLAVSARANAMCLFNPVYDNGPSPEAWGHIRVGDRYPELSPTHNISSDDTPNIVFNGTEDPVVPVETVRRFRTRMVNAGVRSELRIYEGAGHSFFLRRFHNAFFYNRTLTSMHLFLQDLGWIDGPPVPADF